MQEQDLQTTADLSQPGFLEHVTEWKYDTGWPRFGALILDGFVVGAMVWLVTLLSDGWAGSFFADSDALEGCITPIYNVWLIYAAGRTLGKRLCGLRVVSYPDEGKASLKAALMREIYPVAAGLIALGTWIIPGEWALSDLFAGLNGLLALGGLPWVILELVTMLRSPQRRAFHDKIAGTIVIRER